VFPKAYADFAARLRAPGGFLLMAAFAWFSHPTFGSLLMGIPIALVGLWVRAWAAGHLSKNQTLATSGPYAYTRNPLYLGTALVALGMVIACRSLGLAIVVTVFFVLLYLPAIQLEEQHLRQLFPEYAIYAKKVPKLWPKRGLIGTKMHFKRALYMRNQEYQAAVAFSLGMLWLVWKAWKLW
jgi:protein-S-isoprenylcysteine O-methyltransferase Ste14